MTNLFGGTPLEINWNSPRTERLRFAFPAFGAPMQSLYPRSLITIGANINAGTTNTRLGSAVYLPGNGSTSSAQVQKPAYFAFDSTKSYAYSIWFTIPADRAVAWTTLFAINSGTSSYVIHYINAAATNETGIFVRGGGGTLCQRKFLTSWTLGKIYHLVLNWNPNLSDSIRARIWRDGVEMTSYFDSSDTVDGSFTPTSVSFGWNTGWTSEYCPLIVHEFRMYDKLLSDAQIRELYSPDTRFDIYQPAAPTRWWQGYVVAEEETPEASASLPAYGKGQDSTSQSIQAYGAGGIEASLALNAYGEGSAAGLWPFTDDFTGTNGDPWNASKWTTQVP